MSTGTQTTKPLSEIHRAEQEKWDALAPDEASNDAIIWHDRTFASVTGASRLLEGVADFLGDLEGKDVLEYGCGLGDFTVLLARSGANVTTFDLSSRSVAYTLQRAAVNGVESRVRAITAPAENLPFDDGSFDVVFGKAILHHIDTRLGPPELSRLVRPGGKAAFTEPLSMNPVLNFVRESVPYMHKFGRGEDHPLNYDDIDAWAHGFSNVEIREIQLLSMIERALGYGKRIPVLRRADDYLLARFPKLRRYCRYAILLFTK